MMEMSLQHIRNVVCELSTYGDYMLIKRGQFKT